MRTREEVLQYALSFPNVYEERKHFYGFMKKMDMLI